MTERKATPDESRQVKLLRNQIESYLLNQPERYRLTKLRTNYRFKRMYEFEGMPYAWLSFAEAVLTDNQGNANPVTAEDVAVITAALSAEGTTLSENALSGDVKIYLEQEASYHAYEGVKLVRKGTSLYLVFGVAREKLMRKAGVAIPRSLPPLPSV